MMKENTQPVIKLTLPLPLTVNQCYGTDFNTRRRFKSLKYKDWEKEAFAVFQAQRKYALKGDEWLAVEYKFFMSIYGQKGQKLKNDAFNREKPLSDFLEAHLLGFEDHRIKVGIVSKEHTEKDPYVEITINEI